VGPAGVLHEFRESRIAAQRDERDRFLAEAALFLEINLADAREAFERGEAAGFFRVSVGPLVVAGRVNQRGGEGVELVAAAQEENVAGFFTAAEGVAEMHAERGCLAIHLRD